MEVVWIRGGERISYTKPSTWFVMGIRGSGKSSFLEHIGIEYLKRGTCIVDLFGSRDGEGLAWLRSPYARTRRILLLHGGVKASCSKSNVDIKHFEDFTLSDVERYDIIISSSPLYSDIEEEYDAVNTVVDRLYRRFKWRRLVYLIVREASQLYYSRLKISKNQSFAKANFVYLLREARHMGIALGLDTLKFKAIESDIRVLSDYLVLKQLGLFGLPDDLSWLYSFFDPLKLQNLGREYFIIITRRGSIGIGYFEYPKWHKKEKEDIIGKVGLRTKM